MDERDKKMEIATFKFGVIADFVTGVRLEAGDRAKLLREKASRSYTIPYSTSTSIGASTIRRWIRQYRDAGGRIEGLMPSHRKDKGIFRAFDSSLQIAVKEVKEERPELTAVAVINELRHRKIIGPDEAVNMNTLYRFLKKYDLERPKKLVDRRAFEAPHPNELWQSDVLHGPNVICDGKNRKTYLIAIIDDHSRLITHAEFYLSEKLDSFKDCLKKAIVKRGIPLRIYIDNGSCYKAINLEQVAACLGMAIIHTPPYTPQGRGKIERWFRYVRDNFLPKASLSLSLSELNEVFWDWVEDYQNKVHSITKQTPLNRYQSSMKCVRPAPPDLLNYFRFIEFRRVQKDRTFRLNGTLFEAPVELIDFRVELRFHRDSPDEVEIFFKDKSFGMATMLDKAVNFKIGRNSKPIPVERAPESISSGELF